MRRISWKVAVVATVFATAAVLLVPGLVAADEAATEEAAAAGVFGDRERNRVNLSGSIYGDNFFDFYVNGSLVESDERLLPHTGFHVDITLDRSKENVLAVLLRDNANTDMDELPGNTGLEWGERCIGDGGFRLNLSSANGAASIVSNTDWVCRTVHLGPVNPEQCFGVGLDFTGNKGNQPDDSILARPTNPIQACRDNGPFPAQVPGPPGFLSSIPIVELESDNLTPATDADGNLIPQNQNLDENGDPAGDPVFYPEICRSLSRDWFVDDVHQSWASRGYDDAGWEPAVAFTDLEVGYGVPVSQDFLDNDADDNEINPNPANPAVPKVEDWGEASFIWQPSLRYDNWVVCRISIPANTLPRSEG